MINKQITFLLSELNEIFGDDLISVVLFGSHTRKNYSQNSDIDLLIVANKEAEEKEIKKLRMDSLIKFGKKIDLHFFSKREIISNFNHCSPLFTSLLLGKKIIFDKEMFFKDQFKSFIKEMVKEKIIFCEGDKVWEMNKVAKGLEASQ